MRVSAFLLATATSVFGILPAGADSNGMDMSGATTSGLFLPPMNAAEGRLLFASKGCVFAIRSMVSEARMPRRWTPNSWICR